MTTDDTTVAWLNSLLDLYQQHLDHGCMPWQARQAALTTVNKPSGGFQATADLLSDMTKRKYSRQSIHQLWKRRNTNGFPDKHTFPKVTVTFQEEFDLGEVRDWREGK